MVLPTLKVKNEDSKKGFMIINESEFDPEIHSLYDVDNADVDNADVDNADVDNADVDNADVDTTKRTRRTRR